jgi:hypothetical protein
MEIVNVLLLIAGGILAVSGLIVVQKPNAKELIDKLVPFQALIGVGMLVLGVMNLLRTFGGLFASIRNTPVIGIAWFAVLGVSILLGFLFGMTQIAKWAPGAEQKGMELSRKLAPFQVLLGLAGLAASLIWLLNELGLLKFL